MTHFLNADKTFYSYFQEPNLHCNSAPYITCSASYTHGCFLNLLIRAILPYSKSQLPIFFSESFQKEAKSIIKYHPFILFSSHHSFLNKYISILKIHSETVILIYFIEKSTQFKLFSMGQSNGHLYLPSPFLMNRDYHMPNSHLHDLQSKKINLFSTYL